MTEEKHESLETLPMVPLRDVVVFPHTMIPFVVGRKSSLRSVEDALKRDKKIFLSTQKDARIDNPAPGDINPIGTIANIIQSLKLPNGNVKLLVEGNFRGRVVEIKENDGSLSALVKVIDRTMTVTPELEKEMQKTVSLFCISFSSTKTSI